MWYYFETLLKQLDYASMGEAALRVISVFVCLTIHETCHGLAAYALGDPTAKQMHRLSLNPLRHIDWFGLAMMFAAGFGWAKPVPVNPQYFKKPRRGMALTALAGPVSNFLLSFILIWISKLIYLYIDYTPTWNVIYDFLSTTAILSIGLGIFNLLPIPPLDGSKVAGALLSDRKYFVLMKYERFGLILLVLLFLTNAGAGYINRAIVAVYTFMLNVIY